jgi:hypothetical protein
MAIDKEKFVKILVEYLTKNNQTISILNSKHFGKDSIWAKVATSIYGNYNKLKVLELYSAYKNNSSIKTKLLNVLKG